MNLGGAERLEDVLPTNGENNQLLDELLAKMARPGSAPTDVRIIRRGTNLVLQSASTGLVYRVNTAGHAGSIVRNLGMIDSLIKAGAPLLGPSGRPDSWTTLHGPLVGTVWPAGTPLRAGDEGILGQLLAHLHNTPLNLDVPELEVADRLHTRLHEMKNTLPQALWKVLRDKSEKAIQLLDTLQSTSKDEASVTNATVLLHGDAHIGNAVYFRNSSALIDLDDICRGPRGFDLAPAMVSHLRFHRDAARWAAFIGEYEMVAGPINWSEVQEMTLIREATMNTWLSTLWNAEPNTRSELMHRIETWDIPPQDHAPWKAV